MNERKVKVETYMIHADCECGGEFKRPYLTHFFDFEHKCNKCGELKTLDHKYPRLAYAIMQ